MHAARGLIEAGATGGRDDVDAVVNLIEKRGFILTAIPSPPSSASTKAGFGSATPSSCGSSATSPRNPGSRRSTAPTPSLIRFPADHFELAILGHQWKPAWLLIFSRSLARAAQRIEMVSSRASRVGMCLLTTGSSTRVHSVSAGCTSGV